MTVIVAGSPWPLVFEDKPPRACRICRDPIFGECVDFMFMSTGAQAEVRDWLLDNVGANSKDYQLRGSRVSFIRADDALMCYLRFQ